MCIGSSDLSCKLVSLKDDLEEVEEDHEQQEEDNLQNKDDEQNCEIRWVD